MKNNKVMNIITEETKEIFKTPSRRNTLRPPPSVAMDTVESHGLSNTSVTQIKRAQSSKSKTVRKSSLSKSMDKKNNNKSNNNNKLDDIGELEEKFQSQASLRCITDDYFNLHCGGSRQPKCSNRNMSSLGSDRLTAAQASEMLGKLAPPFFENEIAERIKEIEHNKFPRIMIQLLAGYNVLLFGFGSKMKVLELFHRKYLKQSEHNSIVINGFSPEINIQMVLQKIAECLNISRVQGSVQTMAETIRNNLQHHPDCRLFIVIHNIDGPSLRNSVDTLSVLTEGSSSISIIGTVDHVHSPFMWTTENCGSANSSSWLWHNCSTAAPYTAETKVSGGRLMASDKARRGEASLAAVVGSLNSKAKAVFFHLARFQLSSAHSGHEGMSLDSLYMVCKDNLLVTSELALRQHLTEFRDHKLVSLRQGLDRSDFIRIELDRATVQQFVDNFTEEY